MDAKKIYDVIGKQSGSILSFPERGEFGSSSYRGNCSGYIQAYLAIKYHVTKMAELFSGSGTGYDVCKALGIEYTGADLNPVPARPGILNINAVIDDVPDSFRNADMVFMHPPYGAEIGIPYAGSMYPDPDGTLSKSDLGQMPWKQFMHTLNEIVMKYFAAMDLGYMAILMGDVRRNHVYHSMLADIVKPGQLDAILVKAQHNTWSGNRNYNSKGFTPIEHEYLMILKKVLPYLIAYQIPLDRSMDIRDSSSATWKDIVSAVMRNFGREVTLDELYSEIGSYKKCQNNPNWKAKVRQTLQRLNYQNVCHGKWVQSVAV